MTATRTTAPRTSTMALAGGAFAVAALVAIGAGASAVAGGDAAAESFALVASAGTFVALVVLAFGDGHGWDAVDGSGLGRTTLAVAAAAVLGIGALLALHSVDPGGRGLVAAGTAHVAEAALGCVSGVGLLVAAGVARRARRLPTRVAALVALLGLWWVMTAVTGLFPGPAGALSLLSGSVLQAVVGVVLVVRSGIDRD